MLPGHAPEAAGAAALLLHEARVQIGLVIRAADWLQRGRAHPATPAPLEHRQTLGQRHLGRERSGQCQEDEALSSRLSEVHSGVSSQDQVR